MKQNLTKTKKIIIIKILISLINPSQIEIKLDTVFCSGAKKNITEIEQVQLDEMWSFIGKKKKKCWIWLALDKASKRFLGFVTGSRGKKTGIKLWNKIQDFKVKEYATDGWEAYQDFLPKDKHLIGKKYTQDIEGFNSNFRLFLKRLNQKN